MTAASRVRPSSIALRAHQDPAAPTESSIRGRAVGVGDDAVRAAAAAAWPFEVDETYRLFELRVEHAVIGRRPSADDWSPVYATWGSTPDLARGDRTFVLCYGPRRAPRRCSAWSTSPSRTDRATCHFPVREALEVHK